MISSFYEIRCRMERQLKIPFNSQKRPTRATIVISVYDLCHSNITGIKHDVPYINIRYVPRGVLKTEGDARGFQHSPMDLANVKQ